MSIDNREFTHEEQILMDDLYKRSMTELTLGEKEVHTLIDKTIQTMQSMARERAYWQFKAECYRKDIAKLEQEIHDLYEDRWIERRNYE